MTIRFLNCFTCNARIPRHWRSGMTCLLVDGPDGLIMVDTGLGTQDYKHPPGILQIFKVVTVVPLIPEEAAIHQIEKMRYQPEDICDIVLTHMHFDHAGGLPDFPWAKVHAHRREFDAIQSSGIKRWTDGGYNRHILDHNPDFQLYEDTGEKWYEFDAIRLRLEPEMYLLPLFGHTAGHCGVAIKDDDGWLLHAGDAASFAPDAPEWAVRFVLGRHQPRLRAFVESHPEVRMTTGHMELSFFT